MNDIQTLVESTKYKKLNTSDAQAMKILLENAAQEHQKMLLESNVTGDIAQFTPILMPLVREAFPKLIANELLGVQPMTTPTGFMYALVNRYVGNGTNTETRYSLVVLGFDVVLAGKAAQETGGAKGILAVEGKYVLVDKATFEGTNAGTIAGGLANIELLAGVGGGAVSPAGIYSNAALFDRIFSNYSGTYSTAQGETLNQNMNDVLAPRMNEVGISIERKSIEAKTRALKARYTVEMFQDLKAQHGLAADEELISLISNEVRSEIDRDVINFVNRNATIAVNPAIVTYGDGEPGRWELEAYRAQAARISKEAALIGVQTRRAQGNILLVSPMVSAMLQQAGNFKTATVDSTIDAQAIGGVVGTFDNRFKVIVDQYAQNDYCTVLYKGADRRDGMGVFAPYVPLQFQRVTDYESGQPAIIAKTRYALDTIPDTRTAPSEGYQDPTRGSRYARTFGVDLSNTVLG